MAEVNIRKGLLFQSTTFSDTAEILFVIGNQCDVLLTSSEGFGSVQRGWNLEHVKDMFDKGIYTEIKIDNTISIW